MVKDSVNEEPLHLDPVASKLVVHASVHRVFALPLGALVLVSLGAQVHTRGLVHVRLTLVVTEHHLAVQLQLHTHTHTHMHPTDTLLEGRLVG